MWVSLAAMLRSKKRTKRDPNMLWWNECSFKSKQSLLASFSRKVFMKDVIDTLLANMETSYTNDKQSFSISVTDSIIVTLDFC